MASIPSGDTALAWEPPEDAVLAWEPPEDALPTDTLAPDQIIALGDEKKVERFTKASEILSRTPPLGIGEHMLVPRIDASDRELFKAVLSRQYAQDQSMKEAGYGTRLATSIVQGGIDFAMPLAKRIPGSPIPKLDPDQERFRQELLGLREGLDPTIRPDTNFLGRGVQQVGRMAMPMVQSIGAGKALGAAARVAGAGKLGVGLAGAAGTSGSFLPQIADQTHASLIGEGVDPDIAWKVTAISAPIEAAVESILPDPFSGYGAAFRGTVRQVTGKLLRQYTVNYTKELSEEGIQRVVNEVALEVGRKMDETVPDQGFGGLLMAGVEEMGETALPLALMMAPGAAVGTTGSVSESASRPGRLELLKSIRAVEARNLKRRAAEVGITGTRSEVRKKLDDEIQREREAQDASQIPSDQGVTETPGQVGPGGEVDRVGDVRERRQVEGGAKQTREVPPAPEVQVALSETTTELARRAARGEDVGRPEGVSEGRWIAMVDQMRKRMGLKPEPTAPQPAPEAAPVEEAPISPAVPEASQEAAQEPTGTTGTKNVKTDELRRKAGLEERVPAEPETFEEWEEQARQKYPDAKARRNRIAELEKYPGRADKVDNAVIGQHIADLENRRKAGEDVRDEMLRTLKVAAPIGTEAGRSLVSRKAERNEDFSLAGIISQHLDAVGTDPSAEQMAKYEELADRVAKAEAALEEVQKNPILAEVDATIAEAKKKPRAKKGTKRAQLQKKADEAVAEFKRVASGRLGAGVPVDLFVAAGKVVKAYAELGVNSFVELMARVRQSIGDITAEQQGALRETWDDARGKGEAGPPLGTSPDVSEIGELARDLTQWVVESGVDAREQVIDAVHEALQEMGVEISRWDTMRAMTKYGEFRELPKDDVSVKVRGIKGEIQQLLHLMNIEAGLAPEKSGVEGRTPTDEERRIKSRVHEAMKRRGYEPTDPETQLKSALSTAKTAAGNIVTDLDAEIRDLEQSIATRTLRKAPEGKTPLKADKELEGLRQQVAQRREQRDKLKSEYEKIFPPTRKQRMRTAEQQAEAAQRQIDNIQEQLKGIREGKETGRKREPSLVPKELQEQLQMWRDRLKAAKKAVKEAELARFEGEGGALGPVKGKKPLTDAQRLEATEKMLDRQIAELTGDLAAGRLIPKEKRTPVTNQAVKDKRARLAKLRELREEARQADPAYQAREAARENARYKKSLERQLAFWQKRRDEAKRGILPKKRVTKTRTDKAILERQGDVAEARKEAKAEIAREKRKQRPKIQKVAELVPEVLNLPRATMTAYDISAVMRQGGVLSAAHPMLSKDAFVPMLQALASERGQTLAMETIKNLPTYELGQKAGVEITSKDGSLAAMEEAFMSRLAEYIPGVAMSERAYMTFLNLQRALVFNELVNKLSRKGKVTDAEAKVLANWVNVATGRGNLGRLQPAAAAFSTAFFSFRNLVSRFQLVLGQPLWTGVLKGEGGGRARVLVAQEYGRVAGSMSLFYGTFALAAAMLWDPDDEDKPTVTFNRRSSDVGKLKFGETRTDPLTGLSQITALVGRLQTGETVSARGKVTPIRGEDVPYGGRDAWDVISDFLRSKLSPVLGTGVDLLAGENVVGEKTTLKTELVPFRDARQPLAAATPLIWEDVYEAIEAQGVPAGTAIGIMAALGWGSQTYGEYTKYKQADAAGRKEQFDKFVKNVEWDSSTPAYSEFLTDNQVKAIENKIKYKKGSVLNEGLRPDPEAPEKRKGLSDEGHQRKLESYQESLESRQKARDKMGEAIQTLDLGYEDAKNLHRGYFRVLYEGKGGEKVKGNRSNFKPSYKSGGKALDELYGKPEGSYKAK